ncbi:MULTISPECIES: GFA family protein [unclassified Phyllobacterium]|uniref:GFA family protein n=1 Tax=Phyllobacterium TaxID=28100 RepID=UPI0004829442|nr:MULTISPECIES: GFA family protein [unclassified Phyllobacterium]UGY11636.1 GFA family protein [Phyllobacterium sp. T1018]
MTQRLETCACFCGQVTAEAEGEPFWICYDHDDDCRRAIGSPLTIWVGYKTAQFRFRHEPPKTFSRTSGVVRSFCGTCGTSIGYEDEGIAGEIYLTIGFFDHPEHFAPAAHAYWQLKLPWIAFDDTLPRIDQYSRPRDAAYGTPRDRKK